MKSMLMFLFVAVGIFSEITLINLLLMDRNKAAVSNSAEHISVTSTMFFFFLVCLYDSVLILCADAANGPSQEVEGGCEEVIQLSSNDH